MRQVPGCHGSLSSDYSSGFGGKYGVQADRVDKSAVGFDYQGKTEKHESQTGGRAPAAGCGRSPRGAALTGLHVGLEALVPSGSEGQVGPG